MGAAAEGRRIERRDQLFDFLVANPDGVDINEIEAELGVGRRDANQAIRDLRLLFGDEDTINLPATPRGQRETWRYQLVGDWDRSQIWVTNRICDAEARLKTINAVMTSLVAGTDGRTIEGRKVRTIAVHTGRLLEDLQLEVARLDEEAKRGG